MVTVPGLTGKDKTDIRRPGARVSQRAFVFAGLTVPIQGALSLQVPPGETGCIVLETEDCCVEWTVEERIEGAPDRYIKYSRKTGPSNSAVIRVSDGGVSATGIVVDLAATHVTEYGIKTAAETSVPTVRAYWVPDTDDVYPGGHYTASVAFVGTPTAADGADFPELLAAGVTSLAPVGIARNVQIITSVLPGAISIQNYAGDIIHTLAPLSTSMSFRVPAFSLVKITAPPGAPMAFSATWSTE